MSLFLAGTVLWSNLNLGDLRAAWVMPTLCGREKKAQTASITSKHFVAKIKNSEMRRNHRMHLSLTDSNLESIRHKCFRYRRSSMEVQRQTFEAIYELQGTLSLINLFVNCNLSNNLYYQQFINYHFSNFCNILEGFHQCVTNLVFLDKYLKLSHLNVNKAGAIFLGS